MTSHFKVFVVGFKSMFIRTHSRFEVKSIELYQHESVLKSEKINKFKSNKI